MIGETKSEAVGETETAGKSEAANELLSKGA